MNNRILGDTDFVKPTTGWAWPDSARMGFKAMAGGLVLETTRPEALELRGPGVHTRNGDSIELQFRVLGSAAGHLSFGFDADRHEHALAALDFQAGTVSFRTSDWTLSQPQETIKRTLRLDESHTLTIEKTEAAGDLIKNADVALYLDGERVLGLADQNLLPEMGVVIAVSGAKVLLERFVHRGLASSCPEFLHLGGWQMLNEDSIENNLQALFRGIRLGSQEGVELLVTPEASLTGLFPTSPTILDQESIAEAEAVLRRFISSVPDAPHVVVGLPIWRSSTAHQLRQTPYIASRVYSPDGDLLYTGTKAHSAEQGFWHGYRLNEFEVQGVPISMHICHDHRYPELQTLPVMFGCRLVLHPSNAGRGYPGNRAGGCVGGVEEIARSSTDKTHAFYMNVNAGGGSYIAGPQVKGKVLAVSDESGRDSPCYPMVGEPVECLIHGKVRIHDAFGYWPVRAYRASEAIARSYTDLYRSLGGSNLR